MHVTRFTSDADNCTAVGTSGNTPLVSLFSREPCSSSRLASGTEAVSYTGDLPFFSGGSFFAILPLVIVAGYLSDIPPPTETAAGGLFTVLSVSAATACANSKSAKQKPVVIFFIEIQPLLCRRYRTCCHIS